MQVLLAPDTRPHARHADTRTHTRLQIVHTIATYEHVSGRHGQAGGLNWDALFERLYKCDCWCIIRLNLAKTLSLPKHPRHVLLYIGTELETMNISILKSCGTMFHKTYVTCSILNFVSN